MGCNQPKLECASTTAHIVGLTITDSAHIFHLIGLIRTLCFNSQVERKADEIEKKGKAIKFKMCQETCSKLVPSH